MEATRAVIATCLLNDEDKNVLNEIFSIMDENSDGYVPKE